MVDLEVTKEKVSNILVRVKDLEDAVERIIERNHIKDLGEKDMLYDIQKSISGIEGQIEKSIEEALLREEHALQREEEANKRARGAENITRMLIALIAGVFLVSFFNSLL